MQKDLLRSHQLLVAEPGQERKAGDLQARVVTAAVRVPNPTNPWCQLGMRSMSGTGLEVSGTLPQLPPWGLEYFIHCTDETSMGEKAERSERWAWGPSPVQPQPAALQPDAPSSVLSSATLSCVIPLGLSPPLENGAIIVPAGDSRSELAP